MPDITLEVTVPDVWTTKVLDAFTTITDTQIRLSARTQGFNGVWIFTIAAKDDGENNKQFGERVLRELGKAVIDLVDKTEDYGRYEAEINAINPATSDVPDDVLT